MDCILGKSTGRRQLNVTNRAMVLIEFTESGFNRNVRAAHKSQFAFILFCCFHYVEAAPQSIPMHHCSSKAVYQQLQQSVHP